VTFGLAPGAVPDHLDELEERVRRWSQWLGEKIRSQTSDQELVSAFAGYEHDDLGRGGATEKEIGDPAARVLIYDSTNLARNAHDAVTTLPNPPRHAGGNYIGYADGSARFKRRTSVAP